MTLKVYKVDNRHNQGTFWHLHKTLYAFISASYAHLWEWTEWERTHSDLRVRVWCSLTEILTWPSECKRTRGSPLFLLFSGDSTGGRERGSEGFLEAKPTETHEDIRSTGENKDKSLGCFGKFCLEFGTTCNHKKMQVQEVIYSRYIKYHRTSFH